MAAAEHIAATVGAKLARQSGRRAPNAASSLAQSNRLSAGRLAGVGQSAVAIGSTVGTFQPCRPAASKIAVAKPCQVVSPLPVAW
jgi:hypothetical protein